MDRSDDYSSLPNLYILIAKVGERVKALEDQKLVERAKAVEGKAAANAAAAEKAAEDAAANTTAINALKKDADTRLKTLETAAQNAQQAATDMNKALGEAKTALQSATEKLKKMEETDEAIGRVIKATAMIAYTDLNTLIAKLKENGATDADLKLFGIKT